MGAQIVKIVITGPFNSGKTAFIRSVSEIDVVSTERKITAEDEKVKATTTVALDFGRITVDDDLMLYLFGTPGQKRFDFMWEILSQGSIGLILMLDNTRSNPLKDLQFFMEAFADLIAMAPMVIGVSKMDLQSKPDLDVYREYLNNNNINAPVFEVDAREENDVKNLVMALLFSIDPGLEA